uniref:ATP synthase F0 subunit 8 n=1 Tax=Xylocopa appendiculata TaxID=135683 RepID=A0A343DRE3_9HYME|nr:ATP synthase F0 subunit 8 [Xylocopa appendiculata]
MIPQMSPMKWLYIAFLCKMNFIMTMFILNSMPMNLNYKKIINKSYIKWTWYW